MAKDSSNPVFFDDSGKRWNRAKRVVGIALAGALLFLTISLPEMF